MLALNGLPRGTTRSSRRSAFLGSSDDRFFICIEAARRQLPP
jgi:hypothetical protein